MKKYEYSISFFPLIVLASISFYVMFFTLNSLCSSFNVFKFSDWIMLIFTILGGVAALPCLYLFIRKILNIAQYLVVYDDYLEFPKVFFFIKPKKVMFSDIINSEIVTVKRGYLVERRIKLTLKNTSIFIMENNLTKNNIEDLQNEIINKIK